MQNLLANVLSLTPLKRLIATTIQSQLSRFIEGIELDSLGLLGGDLVLENLELRKDVVQELLGIPTAFDLNRGFIKELRIHIPWTRLTTKPIEIKFHTVEIVVVPTKRGAAGASGSKAAAADADASSLEESHVSSDDDDADAAAAAAASEAAAAPSWTQTLIRRALANVSITAENLVLKLDDGEVVLSATLPSFRVHSADPDLGWESRWLNLFGPYQLVHKLVEAKQLTVCLDRYTPDAAVLGGRTRSIVGFERPLLDRISLTVRLQIPLERRPAFERLEREQLGNRVLSDGAQADQETLAAYGSGDLSSGYFDDSYSWAGVDGGARAESVNGEKVSAPKLSPVFKLPCPSNCGRALAGEVRRPWVRDGEEGTFHAGGGPFDDRDQHWVPMLGWSSPDMNLVDPVAEKYAALGASPNNGAATQVLPSEMPMPSLVADVHCASLKFSVSERQITMLRSLMELTASSSQQNTSGAKHTPTRPSRPTPRASPKSRNTVATHPPPAVPAGLAPPVQSIGWFSRMFQEDNEVGEDTAAGASAFQSSNRSTITAAESVEGGFKKADHSLIVVGLFFPDISVDLLRHASNSGDVLGDSTPVGGSIISSSEAGLTEEGNESDDDSSVESLNVPVFGLGIVKVEGLKALRRKAESPHSQKGKCFRERIVSGTHDSRSPVSFLRFELKGCTLDAHQLTGGGLSFLDAKFQVCGASISPTGPLLAALSSSKALPPLLMEVGHIDSSDKASVAYLGRSAENLLTNYALLRCEDPPQEDALGSTETPNLELAPIKGAAMEARFISISNKSSRRLEGPSDVNRPPQTPPKFGDDKKRDEVSHPCSSGLSVDVRFGRGEAIWSEKVADHLNGFLSEALPGSTTNVGDSAPSGLLDTSTETEMTLASPQQQQRRRMHYYHVECAAITATHVQDITSVRVSPDASGVIVAATSVSMEQSQAAYSIADLGENALQEYAQLASKITGGVAEHFFAQCNAFQVRQEDRVGSHENDITLAQSRPSSRTVQEEQDAMEGCVVRVNGLLVQVGSTTALVQQARSAPVKVILKCRPEMEVSSVAATLCLESVRALSGFVNAAQALTKLGQAQSLDHPPPIPSSPASHREKCPLSLHTGDWSFSASAQGARRDDGIERSAHLALHGNVSSVLLEHLGTRTRTPILATQRANFNETSGAPEPFFAGGMTIEEPSERFLDFLRICTGYQVLDMMPRKQKRLKSAVALPTLRCQIAAGKAHFDVQSVMLAVVALGSLSTEFFKATANQTLTSTQPRKNTSRATAPLDLTEFVVIPTIEASAWLLWLSPHLVFTSPKVYMASSGAQEHSHLDSYVVLSGGELLATTVP